MDYRNRNGPRPSLPRYSFRGRGAQRPRQHWERPRGPWTRPWTSGPSSPPVSSPVLPPAQDVNPFDTAPNHQEFSGQPVAYWYHPQHGWKASQPLQSGFEVAQQQIPQLCEKQVMDRGHDMDRNSLLQPMIQLPRLLPHQHQPIDNNTYLHGIQVEPHQVQGPSIRQSYTFPNPWYTPALSSAGPGPVHASSGPGPIHANSGPGPLHPRARSVPFVRPQQSRGLAPRLSRPFKQARPPRPPKPSSRNNLNLTQIQGQVATIARNPALPVLPAPELPKELYHYTTLRNLTSILRDKALYPKPQPADIILKTARFGPGIYFTDLDPHNTTEDILKNNYGAGKAYLSQSRKTEVCFQFLSQSLPRLVFCEDQSCLGSGGTEHARKIWMVDLPRLDIGEKDGFYFIRELDGLGKAKSVTKKRWNDDLSN